MAEVNPAEVSAILKQQLSGFDATASLDEVGTVLTVGDGIARVYGLSNAQYGELVSFESGMEGIVLNLEEDNVGVVLLGPSIEIKEGDTVKRTERIASLKVGEGIVVHFPAGSDKTTAVHVKDVASGGRMKGGGQHMKFFAVVRAVGNGSGEFAMFHAAILVDGDVVVVQPIPYSF